MLERVILKDETQLDSFAEKSPFVHYMKTSAWGKFKIQTEGGSYRCLGFFENSELKATAMVLQNSWLGHAYCYVPWGPCLDYTDQQLSEDVFRSLIDYGRIQHVQFLRVDPNVIRCHRTITGEAIEDGYSGQWLTDQLIRLGFEHKGYNYAYDGSWTNRYTLIADLSPDLETIYGRYSKQRRTSLNRHQVTGVTTRTGGLADLPWLMKFEKQLSEQDGFPPHSRAFFAGLLQDFAEHAVLYVTEIHFDQAVSGLEQELSGRKYRKDPEARAAKEKELAAARTNLKTYGAVLPIACGLFIRYGGMSWDLYTYNDKDFGNLKPVDNLHAFAMKDMKEHGVTRYDMCGFSGVTDPSDPYYGLYAYKRSFGSVFTEQIGQFDFLYKPAAVKRYRFEQRVYNHFRRRYHIRRYTRKTRTDH